MRRPPAPVFARTCPHCKRDAPETLHNDCPTLLREEADQTAEEKLLWRLFGVGDVDPCTCPWVPEEYWTRYYGAVEPGSTREWDQACPVHGEGVERG